MKIVNHPTTLIFILFATLPLLAQPKPAETTNDLKLKTRMAMEGFNMDSTVYIKGQRERSEQIMPGMNLVMTTIKQCDLRRDVQLNDAAKVYKIEPFADPTPVTSAPRSATPPPTTNRPTRKGGVVTMNVTMTDTGERKEMFGYQARRLKLTMSMTTSPDACAKGAMRMESDGWYIDFNNNFSCREEYVPRQMLERQRPNKPDCVDEFRYNVKGSVRMGYPADVTTTMFDEKGKGFAMRQQILELSRAKLEQALFEIPAGYKEGDPYSVSAMMGGMNPGSLGKMAEAVKRAEENSSAATGAKKAGAVRIGVVTPAARIGQNDVSGNVRSSLMRYLNNGQSVEVVPLNAPQEAASQQCDFVVTSVLSHQPGKSGGLGGFMKKAANVGGAIASGSIPTGGGANDTASQIKSKDEVGFEYQLTRVNGAAVASNTQKRKANSDGDDVISPLLSQAAQEILKAVTQK
jgi:hypothetical protein